MTLLLSVGLPIGVIILIGPRVWLAQYQLNRSRSLSDLHPFYAKHYAKSVHDSITANRVYRGLIEQWNRLPEEVICANSINTVKNKVDKYF